MRRGCFLFFFRSQKLSNRQRQNTLEMQVPFEREIDIWLQFSNSFYTRSIGVWQDWAQDSRKTNLMSCGTIRSWCQSTTQNIIAWVPLKFDECDHWLSPWHWELVSFLESTLSMSCAAARKRPKEAPKGLWLWLTRLLQYQQFHRFLTRPLHQQSTQPVKKPRRIIRGLIAF